MVARKEIDFSQDQPDKVKVLDPGGSGQQN